MHVDNRKVCNNGGEMLFVEKEGLSPDVLAFKEGRCSYES
jgi:hypothetical protein